MIHFKLYRQSDRYTKWFDFRMQKPCALWHSWRKKKHFNAFGHPIEHFNCYQMNLAALQMGKKTKWYLLTSEREKQKKTVDKGTLCFKCFYQRQIKWTPIIRFTYMEKRPSSLTTIKKGRWCDECIFHRLCENKKKLEQSFCILIEDTEMRLQRF